MMDTLPLAQAAQYLGVSRRKVWQLVKKGQLKAERDPLDERRKLVKVQDLERLKETSYGQHHQHS